MSRLPTCTAVDQGSQAKAHCAVICSFCKGLSRTCTHLVIFGQADLSTSSKLRHAAAHQHKTQLFIVGQAWLEACTADGTRVAESLYCVTASTLWPTGRPTQMGAVQPNKAQVRCAQARVQLSFGHCLAFP